MSRASAPRRFVAGILFASSLAGSMTIVRAQDVTESSLNAAFIYTFAKFTEWPRDVLPATATFTACVLGNSSMREGLGRTVKGRQISGRAVSVSEVQIDGKLRSCHLLYVTGVTAAQLAVIVAEVRGAPVLTISDAADFVHQGGIVRMFVENGKIKFDLNLDSAKSSRLDLSSKLLALAAHVHAGPHAQGR